jgi:DinB superfamily
MDISALLLEIYGRIPPLAREAVDGVAPNRLVESPSPGTNHIAWLVWHLARVQDSHVAELLESDQLWATGDGGWAARFGLDPDPWNTGYGHSASEVATVRPDSPGALLDYLDAVSERTNAFLAGLAPADLDRVVDRRFDPPVTLGVRLVSVADDCLQHAGQAAYVRGLLGA